MRKRILLAEELDTTRNVAESVLRQNGYEVISVTSYDKAVKVLNLALPNLIIVGSDLIDSEKKPLYEYIQNESRTAPIPLLILSNPDETGLPFPEEVIIPRPLEPKEFMEKVNTFIGQSSPKEQIKTSSASNPLSEADLEDDFLDAALGLDSLDVTDSEVMDRTHITANKKRDKAPEKMIGFDHYEKDTNTHSKSNKVESLIIEDEDAEIGSQVQKKEIKPLSASGKIEILNDQFGLIDPAASEELAENQAHDYDWFINEIKKEDKPSSGKPTASSPPPSKNKTSGTSITDSSSMVDPATPSSQKKSSKSKKASSPGVDKFIDEFKKEIKKFQSDVHESSTIGVDKKASSKSKDKMNWQDSIEKISSEQVEIFTKQFISGLSERIAKNIANKIDNDKLLSLLKHEILSQIEKNQEKSN